MRRGADIPIEERSPEELTQIGGTPLAPRGVRVFHPAFDVTPNRLITAIVTERGVVRPPYRKNLARLVRAASQTSRERERR
jgi:methylthioribose-1-phosphate isomerase